MSKMPTDNAPTEFPPVHNSGSEDLAGKPELIFGLVGPIGCNIDAAQEALSANLSRFGYAPTLLHLTKEVGKLFPKVTGISDGKYEQKIDRINRIVELSKQKDFLAKVAILLISLKRSEKMLRKEFESRRPLQSRTTAAPL